MSARLEGENREGTGGLPPEAIEGLPREVVVAVLEWVGPRSVKRFGATCANLQALTAWYFTRREYGLLLANSARLQLKNSLARHHAGCCKVSAADFDARAARHAARVAAALAGSGEGPPRTELEILRFLYPMALTAHREWVLAPYAFEWCAALEQRIVTGDPRAPPRCELLALLHEDALARLERLAREDCWPLEIALAATAAAACDALAPETQPVVTQVARLLVREVKHSIALAGAHERAIWCLAACAAIDRRLAGGAPPSGSWRYISGAADPRPTGPRGPRALRPLPEPPVPLDAQWRSLAGLEGGGRSPEAQLAKFECSPFEPRGELPRDEALLRLAEQIVLGAPPAVPVPNAALAGLIEIAIGSDAETGPPAE